MFSKLLVGVWTDYPVMAPVNVDPRKYYPICITTFALLLFFFGLGARDFWAPVEPRYAEIARLMFAKEEWIVPMVNGELYRDKPILFFLDRACRR